MSNNSNIIYEKNIEKLHEMSKLGDGWNGENSIQFDKQLLDNIRKLLSSLNILQPNIFPTSESYVQVEFYKQNNYLEFIISKERCELYVTDGINLENDFFDEFEYNEEKIISIVKKFYNNILYGDTLHLGDV